MPTRLRSRVLGAQVTSIDLSDNRPIVLRIDQSALGDDWHQAAVRLDHGRSLLEAVCEFEFRLTVADREDVSWYLEDYLLFPQEAAPQVAARVEQRLARIGTQLFERVFEHDGVREIWDQVRSSLDRVRVEISSDVTGATVLPWELLRDPGTGLSTALMVDSFVRVHDGPTAPPWPLSGGGLLRVLLVICRPGAADDVPFRSVAGQLVRLRGLASAAVQPDVLRPPTFARLTEVLEKAWQAGEPYHTVHFDGHGTYVPADAVSSNRLLSPPRPGSHGYLLFEEPTNDDNMLFVDGPALGSLLARTGVSVLVLNACRSAYAEEPETPYGRFATMLIPKDSPGGPAPRFATAYADMPHVVALAREDPVSQFVRFPAPAYGSLALEAAEAGVPGIVAMRYSVLVVTAAQFVSNLYDALLAGQALGTAVTTGRRQLANHPDRAVGFVPRPLQDWSVPVVYEAKPLALFGPQAVAVTGADSSRANRPPSLLAGFPQPPDSGFFGRDDTLLALDRAFDNHSVVLLQGGAGSGKTTAAAEFARWYLDTGGLPNLQPESAPVLFSSLDAHIPVRTILDAFGDAFRVFLDAEGTDWQALDDDERRRVMLETVSRVPVLWVWDSVENVSGFPPGRASAWTEAEQQELRTLLSDLAATRAKMLLTSRRDEQAWLGDLPVRIHMGSMRMLERIQLAEALSVRHGHHIGDMQQWLSLLGYTAGNPLTLRVLVRQAIREGLTKRQELESLVTRFTGGNLAEDAEQDRAESLTASMDHGFRGAFSRRERAQLAVLHLFRDSVDVAALTSIGDPGSAASLPELAELNRPAAISLLDRTVEAGLLSRVADGRYSLHPAVPWYFGRLYAQTYGPRERHDKVVLNAYTAAIARHARQRAHLYNSGHAEVITDLAADEGNLLNARVVAGRDGRWQEVMGCMHGLRVLYRHTGRTTEWAACVRDLLAEPAIASQADDSLDEWRQLLDFQVELARDSRDWNQAEWLTTTVINRDRYRVSSALAANQEQLTEPHRDQIRWLAASLIAAGHIMRERRNADCLRFYNEAAELYRRTGDTHEEHDILSYSGDSYVSIPQIRDLDRAEEYYQTHIQVLEEHDQLGRTRVIARLGHVAHERFLDGRREGRPEEEVRHYLNQAAEVTSMAFRYIPHQAHTERASLHDALGTIFTDAGMVHVALIHYRLAIEVFDGTDRYHAGKTRHNVARALAQGNRARDALLYARAALQDFESEGAANIPEIEETRALIGSLEMDPASRSEPDEPDDGLGGVMAALLEARGRCASSGTSC